MNKRLKYFLLSAALAAGMGLSACGDKPAKPAPVLNLGLHADSAAGAVIVHEGDTLWNISKRYRLPVREIMDLNGLWPPYTLAHGRRLKLPAPVDYRVRGGDTLYSIAYMFHTPVSRLVSVNGITAPYTIASGQTLRIPSAGRRESAMPPPAFARAGSGGIRHAAKPQFIKAGDTANNLGNDDHRPSQTTIASSKRADFIWPVRGKVVSAYGAKEGGLYNDGINIAAPKGTPVAAAADGVVAYVGSDLKGYGNLVLIRHGGGAMTAYAHLSSITLKRGMAVRKGQVIGAVGSTGSVSTTQLHFEIRQGAKACDPREYLG